MLKSKIKLKRVAIPRSEFQKSYALTEESRRQIKEYLEDLNKMDLLKKSSAPLQYRNLKSKSTSKDGSNFIKGFEKAISASKSKKAKSAKRKVK